MKPGRRLIWLLCGVLSCLWATACTSAAPANAVAGGILPATASVATGSLLNCPTSAATPVICAVGTVTPVITDLPSVATPHAFDLPAAPVVPSVTAAPPTVTLPAASPAATLAGCSSPVCQLIGVFRLARPIQPPGRDRVDPSYRFGSTQNGKRDPHHGVEFLNRQGTPVLATAAGEVVVAGDDRQELYGPYANFYGNLVVIQHHLPGSTLPVFTLYAHLSQVSVEVGQSVSSGQPVGLVGMTGSAIGSHLHFEVRLGENSYRAARNPELWLQPHVSGEGIANGGLAGRILDAQGHPVSLDNIVIERLTAPQGKTVSKTFLETYEEPDLVGQLPWQESFALGDIAPGWYRISFVKNTMRSQVVQVLPGELTLVTFDLGEPE